MFILVLFLAITATHVFENPFVPKENFLFYHFNKFFYGVFGVSLLCSILAFNFPAHSFIFKLVFTVILGWFALVCTIQSLKELLFKQISKFEKVGEIKIRLVYGLGFLGFYFFPLMVGGFNGEIDSNWEKSNIPYVNVGNSKNNEQLRFLFKSESHVYAVEFNEKGHPYNIKIIPIDKVSSISPSKNAKNNSAK